VTLPLIVFVPGMKPKPTPLQHHDALLRCLCEGLRRVDERVAASVASHPDNFVRASWTYVFYRRYRDISRDLPGIAEAIRQPGPTREDINAATSWRKRFKRWLYLLGDTLPFLTDSLASDDMRVTLRDVMRYHNNTDGIGDRVRQDLRDLLVAAHGRAQPVLLIGHSLGSVIAWDTLWELSHRGEARASVDLFMTLGSPLGGNIIQRNLKGTRSPPAERFPTNIHRWVNIVAIGELTALDRRMRNDFGDMERGGFVDAIEDYDVLNHYRENGELHVHSEYGYLLNEVTAEIVADWWQRHAGITARDQGE
jgi:hypothetical protein